MCIHMYIHIYLYQNVYVCICVYIYTWVVLSMRHLLGVPIWYGTLYTEHPLGGLLAQRVDLGLGASSSLGFGHHRARASSISKIDICFVIYL